LLGLDLADPASAWSSLGFSVVDSCVALGGVRLQLGNEGNGIVGWTLGGVPAGVTVDGLPTRVGASETVAAEHPNGAVGVDHVVVVTPDFDRTAGALDAAGMPLRRVRDAGGFRQGFRRLGPAILELVEARDAPAGPARFWGLVVVVEDLDALAERLGDRLGAIKPAVQPGRRIATLRRSAGLTEAVAFMDPESLATGSTQRGVI
jgi:hypothetical protein